MVECRRFQLLVLELALCSWLLWLCGIPPAADVLGVPCEHAFPASVALLTEVFLARSWGNPVRHHPALVLRYDGTM